MTGCGGSSDYNVATILKGAQPVPNAVYRNGCRDKHKYLWRDSNVGPFKSQSDVLTSRPLRPAMT